MARYKVEYELEGKWRTVQDYSEDTCIENKNGWLNFRIPKGATVTKIEEPLETGWYLNREGTLTSDEYNITYWQKFEIEDYPEEEFRRLHRRVNVSEVEGS